MKSAQPLKVLDVRNQIERFVASCLTSYCKCKVPDFHRDMTMHLADGSEERLLLEAPRDFAKSTVGSIFFPLYLICCTDTEELQMFSESGGTAGLSTKWLNKIKKEITSNLAMRALYLVERSEPWGQDHIQVQRLATKERPASTIDIYCRGKHAAARGGRGYVIIDDPQGKDDVRSAVKLARDEEWFYEDVINILEPGQRCVFIGSRLSPLSLLSKVARTPGWTHLSYQAFDESGHSIWPEKWPDAELIKRRNEIGVDRFNSEYMNRPKISDNPIIREEWLQHYQQDTVEFRKIEAEGLYTIVGIDPAISQRETADYTAIITVSKTFDKEPRYYIRRAQKFRAPMREWAQQIVVNWSMYKQHLTVIEAVAGFMAAREEIEEQERIHNQRVNLRTVTPRPKEDKATRAYSVQGLFQQGRVFFDTTDRAIQNLIDELLMFTGAQTSLYPDDQVDALVYALIAGEQHSKQGEEQQRDHKPVVPTGAGFTHVSYPLGRLG